MIQFTILYNTVWKLIIILIILFDETYVQLFNDVTTIYHFLNHSRICLYTFFVGNITLPEYYYQHSPLRQLCQHIIRIILFQKKINGKITKTKFHRLVNCNVIYKLQALWSSRNLGIIYVMCCSIRKGISAGIAIEEINDDYPLLPDTDPSRVSHNVIMSTCRLPSMCVVITYNIHMCHIYIYIYISTYDKPTRADW